MALYHIPVVAIRNMAILFVASSVPPKTTSHSDYLVIIIQLSEVSCFCYNIYHD